MNIACAASFCHSGACCFVICELGQELAKYRATNDFITGIYLSSHDPLPDIHFALVKGVMVGALKG